MIRIRSVSPQGPHTSLQNKKTDTLVTPVAHRRKPSIQVRHFKTFANVDVGARELRKIDSRYLSSLP